MRSARTRVAGQALTVVLVVALALAGLAACAPAAVQQDTPSTTVLQKAPTIMLPPADGRFDDQIGGSYPPVPSVTIVSRDRHEKPAPGRYGICYVNAFQTQPEEASFWTGRHPDLLLRRKGKPVTDPDWPGEHLLDTSTRAKRTAIATIVNGWIDGCATAGFRAVEPDNLDSWTRSKGLLTQADNVALGRLLVAHAHAVGLAIAQKNTVELGTEGKRAVGFDFAIAEECQVYDECGDYTAVYGTRVIEIEYTDQPRRFYTRACALQGKKISVILRDRDVVAHGEPGYRYAAC